MFGFQAPFANQGHNKSLPKELFSKSEKNLSKLSYKSLCSWFSDSSIPEIGVNTESKKWETWRARGQIGYNVGFPNSSKGLCERKKTTENNKRKGNEDPVIETSSHLCDLLTTYVKPAMVSSEKKKSFLEGKKYVSMNKDSFPENDIKFIDESDDGFQESNNDKRDSTTVSNANNKSEKIVSLENQSSITSAKAVSTSSIPLYYNESLQRLSEDFMAKIEFEEKFTKQKDVITSYSDKILNKIDVKKSDSKYVKKEQHETSSGSSFLSSCLIFNFSRSSEQIERNYPKNNAIKDGTVRVHQNLITKKFSCCPLSCKQVKDTSFEVSKEYKKHSVEEAEIINKSPKSRNNIQYPHVSPTNNSVSFECKNNPYFSSDLFPSEIFSERIAPMASPEVISPAESAVSLPKWDSYSNGEVSQELCHTTKNKNSYYESNFPSTLSFEYSFPTQGKFKLLHEGNIQVYYLSHTRTIICKFLSSKYLRRWETHHIYLTNDYICSKTPNGFLETPVAYSNINDIHVVGRWDQENHYCIRVVMADGSLLLQTSNPFVRDQWLSSILWKKNMQKYRNVLKTSTRSEIILKEIKGLIYLSLNSPFQDDCITKIPIEIISNALEEDEIWNDHQSKEEVIIALAPLLENSAPSPEMCKFFSHYCLCYPRSSVIVDIFTTIVCRILKHTLDFGKSQLTRRFVADFFKALHSQNDGDKVVRKFIASIHGTNITCPHSRVLPNLVAVSLAAVFSHFEERKTLLVDLGNDVNCAQAVQLLDKQLGCFMTLFLTISEYEDWRPGLAQLLQPIPFPDDALSHDIFIESFAPVIRRIGMDSRCNVHEMILGIRENKKSWLSVFCPSNLVCKDDGVLWCQMLQTLLNCCCKRRSFLQNMVKHLGALLLVALRDNLVALDMLCLMLEWRIIAEEDRKMQVVTTLQTTESGRKKYNELCKRQENLSELQKEGGPKKLIFPTRSSDADVARLLSCVSFGNLESLSLAFTHVTSACAHQLIRLPTLRCLNLWATRFGDAGLIVIAEHLDKLQVLNLCETPVSDKGIAAIAAMRSLKKLNLNSTKLSSQTLDLLKQKLPTLQELDVRYTDAW